MDWWSVLKGRGKIRIPKERNRSDDSVRRHFALTQPQVMDHVMPESKARSTNTLPIEMGPPNKFRRRRNLKTRGDLSPFPPRRKPVAYDRPGFRTGGGETLPLPDTQQQRDKKTLQQIGEELNNLISSEMEDRRKKVNVPRMKMPHRADMSRKQRDERSARMQQNQADRNRYEQKYLEGGAQQRMMDLSAQQGRLFAQQYDQTGNRIEGEQNE